MYKWKVAHCAMYVGNLIILQCIKTPGMDKSDIDVKFFFSKL